MKSNTGYTVLDSFITTIVIILLLPYYYQLFIYYSTWFFRPLDAKRSAESLAQLIRCCVTTDLNGNIGMKDGTALLISQAVKSFFLIKSSATEALDVDLDGEGLASVLR